MSFDLILNNPVFYTPAYSKYCTYYTNGSMFTVNCDNCHRQNLDVSMGSPDDPDHDLCIVCYNLFKQYFEPENYSIKRVFIDEIGSEVDFDITPRNIIQNRFQTLDWLANNGGYNDNGTINETKIKEHDMLYHKEKLDNFDVN